MADAISQVICIRGEEIGAYLDGELPAEAQQLFEAHLAGCAACARELGEQKGLLRTLDFAFGPDQSVELPEGFSQLVALRAESDVSGFRTWSGNGRALRLSAALALGVLLLLGLGAGEPGPSGARNVLLAALGLLDLVSRLLYDLVVGLVVVFRAVGRWLVHTPSPFFALFFVLFFGAVVVLVRQIVRFHRG